MHLANPDPSLCVCVSSRGNTAFWMCPQTLFVGYKQHSFIQSPSSFGLDHWRTSCTYQSLQTNNKYINTLTEINTSGFILMDSSQDFLSQYNKKNV